MVKVCTRCNQEKPITMFHKRSDSEGLQSWCKQCQNTSNLESYYENRVKIRIQQQQARSGSKEARQKLRSTTLFRRYKITLEQFNRLLELQNYSCAICSKPAEFNKDGDPVLYVDHDHNCCPGRNSCGQCVRGLLCNTCNKGISLFNDNPDLLLKAADYLNITKVDYIPDTLGFLTNMIERANTEVTRLESLLMEVDGLYYN